MSHDPWMEDSNSLDLTDNTESRVHAPFVFTRDHADWLTEGELPDTTAIIQTLISHRDLIMNNHMIYLIVDNRTPAAVPYWQAFAAWWASRRCLVGPQEETTDILWICADATTGLHNVPYYWAGVFVLEAARFLYPAQHFALIDNDCVPITLFEVQDLLQLAHQQHRWVDLIGYARSESSPSCWDRHATFYRSALGV